MASISKERKEANKVDSMELIGNVEGKTCILVDDMIDTAGTLCEAAKLLKEKGAKKVYVFATHGLFSGEAGARIAKSELEMVITTNTIKPKDEFVKVAGEKYK
jgi:ribose-phosphate pyrophosphokinase